MTITLLKKQHTRLRVKEVILPASESPVLGVGVDVMHLPEGHLNCIKCKGHLWECWVYTDNHRLEMGCVGCGWSTRLLFPLDVSLSPFGASGRWTCRKHPSLACVLIHNVDCINIGCERCFRDVTIKLRKAQGLIVDTEIN